jgi:hypothetical protein
MKVLELILNGLQNGPNLSCARYRHSQEMHHHHGADAQYERYHKGPKYNADHLLQKLRKSSKKWVTHGNPPDTSRDLQLLTLVYWVSPKAEQKREFEAALALVFEDFVGAVGVMSEVGDFRSIMTKS